jgi:hypothetical protein
MSTDRPPAALSLTAYLGRARHLGFLEIFGDRKSVV